jgi:DNA (cytosine-5)-methyltransferase 1
MTRTFLEFFAGGGMARAGFGPGWRCLFANDVDASKCAAYRANWGDDHLIEADIRTLGLESLPNTRADLAWASFPCQDLSLAGRRGGLSARRSGLFFDYARLIGALRDAGRGPRLLVIENVTGLLTSRDGADFRIAVETICDLGYAPGALVIDARCFLPQSRPRLFIFGFAEPPPGAPAPQTPDRFAPAALRDGVARLSGAAAAHWVWIEARPPRQRVAPLASLIDFDAPAWSEPEARRILAGMTRGQRAAVEALRKSGGRHVGTVFRRMRVENGESRARHEARFDGLAGCLRTPAGGSSVQRLLRVDDGAIAARQLSPREAARLMGLPDDYVLPAAKTQGLKLCGDGVAVPVARWIAEAILEPALAARRKAA